MGCHSQGLLEFGAASMLQEGAYLEIFDKVQVIASVLFGIASSALGPFM